MNHQQAAHKRQREIENMNMDSVSSPVSSPQLLELPSIPNPSSPRKKQKNLQTSPEIIGSSDGVQQAFGVVAPLQITTPGLSASLLLESLYDEDNNPANFSEYNPQDSIEHIFQDFDQILQDFLGSDRLMEEISTINQQLMSTYVEICDENDNSTTAASFMEDSRAKIVKCTFRDLGSIFAILSSEHPSRNLWPIQPLKLLLLIPGTYPGQSPLVLDKLSTLAREDDGASTKNEKDVTGKAISKLKLHLESFEQPLSIKKIAKAWGDVAGDVVHENSKKLYLARIASRYGVWGGMCASAC